MNSICSLHPILPLSSFFTVLSFFNLKPFIRNRSRQKMSPTSAGKKWHGGLETGGRRAHIECSPPLLPISLLANPAHSVPARTRRFFLKRTKMLFTTYVGPSFLPMFFIVKQFVCSFDFPSYFSLFLYSLLFPTFPFSFFRCESVAWCISTFVLRMRGEMSAAVG